MVMGSVKVFDAEPAGAGVVGRQGLEAIADPVVVALSSVPRSLWADDETQARMMGCRS